MAIGAQRAAVEPGVGDGVANLLARATEQLRGNGGGGDADGAGPHLAGGMGDDVPGGVPDDLVPIEGQRTEATLASAAIRVWAVLRVRGEVPFEDGAAPMAGGTDKDVLDVPGKVAGEVSGSARPLFREVEAAVGMGGVDLFDGFDLTGVEVEGGAFDEGLGLRIGKDGQGIVGLIGVVVVADDACGAVAGVK